MKVLRLAVPLIVCFLVMELAQSKPKKPEVPAVFENAHYVYVQAVDGDILKPELYPEDRQAISDVQDSLRQWARYALAINRDQADLVFVVRRGRVAGAQLHGGISGGSRPQPGQGPVPISGTQVGAAGEVGPEEDLLRVFLQNEGKLTNLVWSRELEGGLDAPEMQLMAQLRAAVEKAYPPSTSAGKKP